MDEDKRNLLIFLITSFLILVGYQYFFEEQKDQQKITAVNGTSSEETMVAAQSSTRTVFESKDPIKAVEIRINSKKLRGIISTLGMQFNNVLLKNYKEDDKLENVSVFGKLDDDNKYYASLGWISDDNNVIVPNNDTIWETKSKELTEETPILVTWDNHNGQLFERQISVDDNYVMTITDKVRNYGDKPVSLRSLTQIHREFKKDYTNTWSAYEGPLGYLDGKLKEISYNDIVKEGIINHHTVGGWFGITDKYWLVAFIPDQTADLNVSYYYKPFQNKDEYHVDSVGSLITIAPSQEISRTYHIFLGAKEINTLDMYEQKLGVKHFDLAIDFGYLYVLTKPLLYLLAFIKETIGSMGLAILILTLMIKLLLLPLAQKSYKSMNRMKNIQPKIQELQRKYANDRVKLGQAVSELYRKEGVSPVGGCLPALLQSPVLIALYKILYISIEMRQAPFYGWISDLSLPDPVLLINLGGLLHFDPPGFLQIGIWPVLMGLSMYLQQKMTPNSAVDPTQNMMMLIMPIMFTFMFAQLPSGLVIYWTFSNVLSLIHQYLMMRADMLRLQKAKAAKDKKAIK
ncbi:MAG: membrane protein insertase YidC [Alphaproteobacteria bacterium]|nr:membrane protein insertase YidC [Alphaproteobacteria bacterium]